MSLRANRLHCRRLRIDCKQRSANFQTVEFPMVVWLYTFAATYADKMLQQARRRSGATRAVDRPRHHIPHHAAGRARTPIQRPRDDMRQQNRQMFSDCKEERFPPYRPIALARPAERIPFSIERKPGCNTCRTSRRARAQALCPGGAWQTSLSAATRGHPQRRCRTSP